MGMKYRMTMGIVLMIVLLLGTALSETFLVTSDLHLTEDRAAHDPALDAVTAMAAGYDGVLVLGDSANNAHDEEHAYVLEFLGALGRPAYVVPGNHDITRVLHPIDFVELYAEYGWGAAFSRDDASASCAVTTAGGTCLLLIDTNAYTDLESVAPLGGIPDATVEWVASVLDALPPGTPVVACGHHPILPPESRDTPNAGKLAEALRQGGAKVYLCGHDHGFAAVNIDGLQQITVGQPHAYPGWAGALTVDGDGFHWRVVELYADDDPVWLALEENAAALGVGIGRGVLTDTPFEGDEAAAQWFAEAFGMLQRSELTPEACERLLSDPAADTWRAITTKTIIRDWMFGILEQCPQDVREIIVN